jgi:hypothetical protein
MEKEELKVMNAGSTASKAIIRARIPATESGA